MKIETSSAALLGSSAEVRALASELYLEVRDLPIVSPHGHVNPELLLKNEPFANPAELLLFFDHYVTRLLHAGGVDLAQIRDSETSDPKVAWQLLCDNWHLLAGTASSYWLSHELSSLFALNEPLSSENGSETYEHIDALLKSQEFLPRALFERFRIELLATTDDPCDDLAAHAALAQDPSFNGRVIPTFRPDVYLDPRTAGWAANVSRLTSLVGTSLTYQGFIEALESRRAFFRLNGAVSADHGVFEPYTISLSQQSAEEIFYKALLGTASEAEVRDFAGHMLVESARMSTEDGLVMTLHAGVRRNHSTQTFEEFGPDSGHDIPVRCEFTQNLRPLLEKYGLNKNLTLILFSLDESNWGREIAPLAGFYPSVRIGAPWWFLDAPDSAMRFRESVTETAGFYRGSGFIDDTRAFLSIPARHDMARRVDSTFLARLVLEGRLTREQASKIAFDLVVTIPKEAFKL
jgi:glucuronate isomerase